MEKKNRVQLDMTNGALDRLDELKDALGLATRAETIRASLNITWNVVMKGFSGNGLSADEHSEREEGVDTKDINERLSRVESKFEEMTARVMDLYSRFNDVQKEREKELSKIQALESLFVPLFSPSVVIQGDELRMLDQFGMSYPNVFSRAAKGVLDSLRFSTHGEETPGKDRDREVGHDRGKVRD